MLSRTRWDPAFGTGLIEVEYADRIDRRLVRAPLQPDARAAGSAFFLSVTGPDGLPIRVPRHRVRRILRDGAVIWDRSAAGPG